MTASRRDFLKLAGAATLALPRCVSPIGPGFLHGVASGDPLPNAVILWTRFTPSESDDDAPVEVTWEFSNAEGFASVLRSGVALATAARDFTVKVDLDALTPGTTYFFRFKAQGHQSTVGRTKTAPRGAVAAVRFAVCSCASLAWGYFHVYRAMAERDDIDAVVHLGDYIYEHATNEWGDVRPYEPAHEIVSLGDYRTRYAQYRRDPDLQRAHARHPFIAVWDDHEFTNNARLVGADNHQKPREGTWAERKAAAVRAYLEWMPVREQPEGRIWRSFAYGDLAELTMLDTRVWARDPQAANEMKARRPTRRLLGDAQERWFIERLSSTSARWKLIGQQVMLSPMPFALNTDQWDGYVAERSRLLGAIRSMGLRDVVVLTGDTHQSWAMEVVEEVGTREAVAVEILTPSITSAGLYYLEHNLAQNVAPYPHIRYAEAGRRGYVLLEVTAEQMRSQWLYVDNVRDPRAGRMTPGPTFVVRAGVARLEREG